MNRKIHLPQAAEEITHTAAVRSGELIDEAKTRLAPLLEQAGAGFDDAKKQGARYAVDAVDKAQPAIAMAHEKLQGEIIPKISELLTKLAAVDEVPLSKKDAKKASKEAMKLAKKAEKESNKAMAKVTGKKSRGPWKFLGTLTIVAAGVAGVVTLLRKYLTDSNESGWAAHEPSTAYRPAASSWVDDAKDIADDAKDLADNAKDAAGDAAEAMDDAAADAKRAADDVIEGEEPSPFAEAAAVEGVGSEEFGAGSYVGDAPPEGFVIKGNKRSMKFHVAGTAGYENTIPDVWFDSEEAAAAAGFTKAQR